jgi:hypothetical protein
MSLSFADYDPLKSGGLPKPGKAHFLVNTFEDKGNYYSASFEIIAHEDPDEVGKLSYNNFNKGGKGARRLQLILEATKVLTREMIEEAVQRGETEVGFDEDDVVGCTFFGLLEEGSYEKDGKTKETCKVEFKFLAVDDKDAKDYPRNEEFAPAPKEEPAKEEPKKEAKKGKGKKAKDQADEAVPTGDDDCPF